VEWQKIDDVNWTIYDNKNSFLPYNNVYTIAIDSKNNKWIGTNEAGLAVFRKGGVLLSAEKFHAALHKKFELSQNYPNPFNPITKIKYALDERASVIIKVYDIMEREIAELINETKNGGVYEIEFNADKYKLGSGIYFYSMKCGNLSTVKKMIFIK